MQPRTLVVAAALLALGAPPAATQTVLFDDDTTLGLDDVEITPDGRLAVVRENSLRHTTRIYDLATGALVATASNAGASGVTGASQDTVAVTNDRAVVIGSAIDVLDLTNPVSPLLASHEGGTFVRDVAITPDGTIAAVRGGQGPSGGLFLIDLATGALLLTHPGQPNLYTTTDYSFDVDGVVANDRYAVMCSLVGPNTDPRCRVTFFRLHPPGGGPPAVVHETSGAGDLVGAPHDLVLTPDGRRLAVRSELEVAVYDVRGEAPSELLRAFPQNATGPFEDEALDSIETTNERVVTLSRFTNATIGVGTQVDVFNLTSLAQGSLRVPGSPHDLALTPDGTRAVVRTSGGVHLVDLTTGVTGPALLLDSASAPGTSVAYFAGMDSVAATDDRAITITRGAVGTNTQTRIWDTSGGTLELLAVEDLADSQPIDVSLTPDATKVVVVGTSKVAIYLVETGDVLLDHAVVGPNAWYPWNDGLALDDEHAVAIGYWWQGGGWISIVDLAPLGAGFCATTPNSAGPGARLGTEGSTSVAANDLVLWADGLPPGEPALFLYAMGQAAAPFGDGTLCLPGGFLRLGGGAASAVGATSLAVDLTSPPDPSGAILPGATWSFQALYRDPAFGVAGFNLSDARSVTFGP